MSCCGARLQDPGHVLMVLSTIAGSEPIRRRLSDVRAPLEGHDRRWQQAYRLLGVAGTDAAAAAHDALGVRVEPLTAVPFGTEANALALPDGRILASSAATRAAAHSRRIGAQRHDCRRRVMAQWIFGIGFRRADDHSRHVRPVQSPKPRLGCRRRRPLQKGCPRPGDHTRMQSGRAQGAPVRVPRGIGRRGRSGRVFGNIRQRSGVRHGREHCRDPAGGSVLLAVVQSVAVAAEDLRLDSPAGKGCGRFRFRLRAARRGARAANAAHGAADVAHDVPGRHSRSTRTRATRSSLRPTATNSTRAPRNAPIGRKRNGTCAPRPVRDVARRRPPRLGLRHQRARATITIPRHRRKVPHRWATPLRWSSKSRQRPMAATGSISSPASARPQRLRQTGQGRRERCRSASAACRTPDSIRLGRSSFRAKCRVAAWVASGSDDLDALLGVLNDRDVAPDGCCRTPALHANGEGCCRRRSS